MNRINFQQPGGFRLETDTLTFLQESLAALQVLSAIVGDYYILSGCVVAGAQVSPGYVVIAGEVLPFSGGLLQTKVMIREIKQSRSFQNGTVKDVFYIRYAEFGNGEAAVLWADLVRIKNLKSFKDLPTAVSDSFELNSSDSLATSKALKLLNDKMDGLVMPGMITIWSGAVNAIPAGWHLCDGVDGRPDLRDKFVLGAGNGYAVAEIGGEATHTLTINEMPEHDHGFNTGDSTGRSDNANDRDVMIPGGTNKTTSKKGGGAAHNNMPPYYSLAYIIKL